MRKNGRTGTMGGAWGSDVPAPGFPDPGFSGPATLGATAPRGSGPRVGLSGGSIMGYDASRPVQAPAPAILRLGPPYRSRPCLFWGPTLSILPPFFGIRYLETRASRQARSFTGAVNDAWLCGENSVSVPTSVGALPTPGSVNPG